MTLQEILNRTSEIDGWFSYDQQRILLPIVSSLPAKSIIMEIGTYQGKSTMFYALANPEAFVITNDTCAFPWTSEFDPAGFRLQNNTIDPRALNCGNIFQVVGRSSEIVKTFHLPIDLLFIDGHHIYEEVKQDINDWAKFIVKGGYLVLHDYDEPHQEVIDAQKECFLSREFMTYKPISIDYNLGIFKK